MRTGPHLGGGPGH